MTSMASMTRRGAAIVLAGALGIAACGSSSSNDKTGATKPGGTSGGTPSGNSKLTLNVTGALGGSASGDVTFTDCLKRDIGYRLQLLTKINGNTVELRIEINGVKNADGSHGPFTGPGTYTIDPGNDAISAGHFEDQVAKRRWDLGAGAAGTVKIDSDTKGSFELDMVSAPYKGDTSAPAPSKVHLSGSWNCG